MYIFLKVCRLLVRGQIMSCPYCNSPKFVKNGSVHRRKKNRCLNCGKQYVLEQHFKRISKEIWELVDKLLVEKLPLAGTARVTGVSERWLQIYTNRKYAAIEK